MVSPDFGRATREPAPRDPEHRAITAPQSITAGAEPPPQSY